MSYIGRLDTKLDEMTLSEEKVLEKLNTVSTAKRLANMVFVSIGIVTPLLIIFQELHDSDFGKRERIHKMKKAKLEKRDKAKR